MATHKSTRGGATRTAGSASAVTRTSPVTAHPSARKPSALTCILTATDDLSELVPQLHQHALEATGAVASILFEFDQRAGALHPTSAGAPDFSADAWRPQPAERQAVQQAFHQTEPTLVYQIGARMPSLTRQLGTAAGLFVPIARPTERLGLLVLGLRHRAGPGLKGDVGPVADAFALALERARLQRSAELQRDVRKLLLSFSNSVSSALNLAAGLDTLCREANSLFDTTRTSVWLHQRRQRELVLAASSDPTVSRDACVSTDDPWSPAARGLRRPAPELLSASPDDPADRPPFMVVPLRGRRRALGTLVLEGIESASDRGSKLLDYADELGRQLSNALENVQLLEAVIRSRRELDNTFNSIADLVAVCDRRLCLVHVNRAFASRVGLSCEDALDRPLTQFIGPETGKWISQLDRLSALGSPNPVTREIHDPVLRGTFSMTLTTLFNQDDRPIGGVMVARDITEQTRLEAERATLRERLTQSEKLAALGQFVAGIAHELNNPLQGVLGHIELLNATGALPPHLQRELRTVSREAERAAKIVRTLLVFAGSRRLVRRRLSLNAIISRALALRTEACRVASIDVLRNYDARLPRLHGDPLLLQQAFLNILINAEHAVAGNGRGRIEISTSLDTERRTVVVRIRDSGKGIPADVLPRIFDPFYTTKDVGQGTGLGLTIAYGIVQEHRGQIAAANHADGGAVFTIELPTRREMIK